VRRLVIHPIVGEPTPELLPRALEGWRYSHGQVISAIGREQGILRFLTLPSLRHDELAQMASLSGTAQLPYPPEQAVVDVHVVTQQAGKSTVCLIAYHQDVIDRHLSLWRAMPLEPSWIVPTSWGLLAWYRRLARAPEAREPVLILHVDADQTDLVAVSDGRLLWSRSLTEGLDAWQHELGFRRLLDELERSLGGLRKDWPGTTIQTVILTGLGPLEEWQGLIEQRLASPVIVRSPHGDLPMPNGAAPSQASVAVLLGLAMAEPPWLVNLLPPPVRQAQRRRRRLRELLLSGWLLLAALLLGSGVMDGMIRCARHLVEHLEARIAELSSVVGEGERTLQHAQLLDGIGTSRRRTLAMLAEVLGGVPEGVVFETLTLDRTGGDVVVHGSAQTTRQVLDYLQQVRSSTTWEEATLRYAARRARASGARTEFELVLRGGARDDGA